MRFLSKDFVLNDDSIVEIRELIVNSYLEVAAKRANPPTAIRATVEELLTLFKKCYGENTPCRVYGNKILGVIKYEIQCKGLQRNPIEYGSDDEIILAKKLLERFCNAPVYRYDSDSDTNIITFEAAIKPIKNKMMLQMLGAVLLAIATFFILKACPADFRSLVVDGFVNPFFTKFTQIITEIATPLVFLAVISGITGIGNATAVGTMGKVFIRNMFIIYGIAAIAFSVIGAIAFSDVVAISASGGAGIATEVVSALVTLVLDIIPNNLLECFALDNSLQVITLAVFIGFVLLSMGKKVTKVNEAINLLADIVNKAMSFVCKFLPLIVYLGTLNMMFMDMSGFDTIIYKVCITWLLTCAVVFAYMLIKTKVYTKLSLGMLFKKQLPTTMINLSTSSQVGAMPENMNCCINKFGIDSKFINFAIPLSIVIYMPCGAAFLGLLAWGMAEIFGIALSLATIIKLGLVSIIIAIAAPPIPGSAFTVMPILFSSCALPTTHYSLAIILGTVIGYFLPLLNGYLMQLEMINCAKELNIIDMNITKNPNAGKDE